ncbi:HET-domain-containing protein [Hyaloscypha variabilis F]|uniref:HET-domain-containing protein n=1 Tax=Hyaloscypha variabilis (strain UAMH 11265 / GT02V1 / F) TaxID=1149755 RepID=A0A2J6S1X0_HYAVF|nr:HET-domain-containing protein [Hyaloscypha variabilis F]
MVRVNDAVDPNSAFDESRGDSKAFRSTQDGLHACKEWLATCRKDHNGCQVVLLSFLPPRLVYVRGAPRVVSFNDLDGIHNYATLSHCWGSQTFLTLSKSNLEEFGRQIPAAALSRTFLDAIFVCQQLGVEYIWIDSLCIIQDDQQDWHREAALMTKVYGHSYINIAASGAADGNDGLFFQRPTTWRCRVKAPLDGGGVWYDCVPFNMHNDSIRLMPLSGRGWAVQERLLPHRSLLFTRTQVFWECYESTTCETFPEFYSKELYHDSYIYNRGVTPKQQVHYIKWVDIVRQYTESSLTFQRDKLVAISGLAQEIQKYTGDQYLAGLWRKNLEHSLLWINTTLTNNNDALLSLKDPPCKVPSWSWASIRMPVSVFDRDLNPREALLIQVLNILTSPEEDPFEAISTAHIVLGCSHMMIGELDSVDINGPCMIVGGKRMSLRQTTFSQPHDKLALLYLLPVLIYFPPVPVEGRPRWNNLLKGLLVRPNGTCRGEFQRIGMFEQYFRHDDHIYCQEDLENFFARTGAEVTDEIYSRVFHDENGVKRKMITLV